MFFSLVTTCGSFCNLPSLVLNMDERLRSWFKFWGLRGVVKIKVPSQKALAKGQNRRMAQLERGTTLILKDYEERVAFGR